MNDDPVVTLAIMFTDLLCLHGWDLNFCLPLSLKLLAVRRVRHNFGIQNTKVLMLGVVRTPDREKAARGDIASHRDDLEKKHDLANGNENLD